MIRDLDRVRRLGGRLFSRLRGLTKIFGRDEGPFEMRDDALPTQTLGDGHCLSSEETGGARQRAGFSQHINC